MTDMNLELADDEMDGIVVGPCTNCGRPVHEHEKERVSHDNGTWSYDYVCPEG